MLKLSQTAVSTFQSFSKSQDRVRLTTPCTMPEKFKSLKRSPTTTGLDTQRAKKKAVRFDDSALQVYVCSHKNCLNEHDHKWWCDHCKDYVCDEHMEPDSIPPTLQAYELCKHCRLTLHECNSCGTFQTELDVQQYGCITNGCDNQTTSPDEPSPIQLRELMLKELTDLSLEELTQSL